MKKKLAALYLSIIVASICFNFSCNSSSSSKSSTDTGSLSTDTSLAHAKDTTAGDDIIFDNCDKYYKDKSLKTTTRSYTRTYKIATMKMAGDKFYEAYQKIENNVYIILWLTFSRRQTRYINLDGVFPRIAPDPLRLTQTQEISSLTITSSVQNERWSLRPALICQAAIDKFIEKLKSKGIDLETQGAKFEVRITPYPGKDKYGEFVGLMLSIQPADGTKLKSGTYLKTNPCPVCNYPS